MNPVFKWIEKKRTQSSPPLLIAISGAQGSGKTTLCNQLVEDFKKKGLKAISISVDDFYLTHEEQKNLAATANDPFLDQRGYPGTHDLPLAIKTLRQLKGGKKVMVPRYDKSAFQGAGDRSPQNQWTEVLSPQDIILFEGWFLGFEFQETLNNPALNQVNAHLKNYKGLYELFDELIYLKPKNVEDVIEWRIEAENNMKAHGKEGMSDEAIRAYINKFIPAYREYRDTPKSSVVFTVQSDRSLVNHD